MRRLLPFLALLTACADAPNSQSKALPFTCGAESASEIYFDQDHSLLLQPYARNEGMMTRLLVFGGSFSDTGILGKKTLDAAVPRCTYWNHRSSNGPIWSDYIAGAFGLEHSSYAVAGAQTNPSSGIKALLSGLLTPLPGQIEAWEKDDSGEDREKTLVVIWIGPNDYLLNVDKVLEKDGTLKVAEADRLIEETIAGIENGILRLQSRGLQHFVLGNVAHLGDIAGKKADAAKDKAYAYLEQKHNAILETLPLRYPGLRIFHSYERNAEVFADMTSFGFDSNDRCYEGSLAGFSPFAKKTFCATPLRTRHWDDIHPNTRMHCWWAEQFVQDVGDQYGLRKTESFQEACLAMRTKSGVE